MPAKLFNSKILGEFTNDRALLERLYSTSRSNLNHYHTQTGTLDISQLNKFGFDSNIQDIKEEYQRINFSNRVINLVAGNFLQELNLPYLESTSLLNEDENLYVNNVNVILKKKLWTDDTIALIEDCIKNSMISGIAFLKVNLIKDFKGRLDLSFNTVYADSVVFDSKTNFQDFDNSCGRFGIRTVLNDYNLKKLISKYNLTLNDIGIGNSNNKFNGNVNSSLQEVNTQGFGLGSTVFNITPEQVDKAVHTSSSTYILDEFYYKGEKKQKYILNTKTADEHFYNTDSEKEIIISELVSQGMTYSDKTRVIPTIIYSKVINGYEIEEIIDPLGNGRYPIIPFVYNQTRGINTSYRFKTLYDEIKSLDDYLNQVYHYVLSILKENATSILLFDASKFNTDGKNLSNGSKGLGNINIKAVNMGVGKSIQDIVYRVPPPEIPSFLPQFIQELQTSLLSVCGLNEVALGLSGSNRDESGINRSMKLESIWKSYEFYSLRLQSSMKRVLTVFADSLISNFNSYSIRNTYGIKAVSSAFKSKLQPSANVVTIPNDITVSSNERHLREMERLLALGVKLPPESVVANTNLPNKFEIIRSLQEQNDANSLTQKLGDNLLKYKTLHTAGLVQNLGRESESKTRLDEADIHSSLTKLQLDEKRIDNEYKLRLIDSNRKFILESMKASLIGKEVDSNSSIVNELLSLDGSNIQLTRDSLRQDSDGTISEQGKIEGLEGANVVSKKFEKDDEEVSSLEKEIYPDNQSINNGRGNSNMIGEGADNSVTADDIVRGNSQGQTPTKTILSKL